MLDLLAAADANVLSTDSAVSIGAIIVIGGAVVTAAVQVLKRIDRLEFKLGALQKERDEDWRMKDQEIFALRLALDNQHIKLIVPDPREIARGQPKARNISQS